MGTQTRIMTKFFELLPEDKSLKTLGTVINKKRIMIGRSENCDLRIKDPAISSIHAVLEIRGDRYRLFDMNSSNGTFVNDEKIVVKEISLGDKITFANVNFTFKEYAKKDLLPPVLDSLSPDNIAEYEQVRSLPINATVMPETPVVEPAEPIVVSTPKTLPSEAPRYDAKKEMIQEASSGEEVPYVAYPLAKDPKAEYSEYIFEDADSIYPIFKWEVNDSAVEIIIINEDQIYSVDYLPNKNGTYYLVGYGHDDGEIEFPYLGRSERVPFVEVSGGGIIVNNQFGYEALLISDKSDDFRPTKQHSFQLAPQDILQLRMNHLQIYVRSTEAPPKVKSAPLLRRDDEFKKFLFLFIFLVSSFLGVFSAIDVDKEKEKEKAPERVATILYKKRYIAPKPKVKLKKATKPKPPSDVKKVVKKQPPKPKAEKKKVVKKQTVKKTPTPVKKKVTKAKPRKGKTMKAGKATRTARKKVGGRAKAAPRRARAKTNLNTQGRVQAYKANFGGALNKLLAKGGSVSGVVGTDASVGDLGVTDRAVGGSEKGIKRADIAGKIGSLEGVAQGKLNVSKGAEGLASKRTVLEAGIPSTTVVTGDYDASIVTQILRDHLEQFKYCYQKELDVQQKGVDGLVRLNFIIGASGHVSKAGVSSASGIPSSVQKCVINVLKGIQFPPPLGGGVVSIKQPMNFQSSRR